MAGIIFSIIMMMLSFVLWCCTQLLLHFDVTNSILVSGVIQLLTLNKDWSPGTRWAMFLGILAVCWILQNISLIMKVLFGLFSSFALGVLGWGWVTYDNVQQQWTVFFICVAVGIFLNVLCWMQKSENRSKAAYEAESDI